MKTETKNLENCQVELTVTLDAEEMKAIVKEVEKTFQREAQLPGFRKGKVPLELVRKEFAAQLQQEKERRMFQLHCRAAVDEAKLESVEITSVKDVKAEAESGSFTAVVDVRPTFKLPAYKGLKISSNEVKVSDEAVSGQLQRMRVAYAKFEDAKEGEAIAEGDFVQIDYSGTVGGKPILELAPEAKVVAGGTGFWLQVEEGRFLPEILDALKGMKIGESKTGVKAKFDKDAAPEGLKGEKALYDVTVKAFRRRILPTDAEFVEKAKTESIEKLTATIREQMEKSAAEQESVRRENEAVELLLKKADFDVPPSQVARATDNYLGELSRRAQYSGLDASYFEQNRDKILADAKATAVRQVRLWYVIEAIAQAEGIEAKDSELGKKVIEFVLANAK